MSYSNIRTAHSVGDVVYVFDSSEDSVQRMQVIGIEARCDEASLLPKWQVLYRCVNKWAAEGPSTPGVYREEDVHTSPGDAFPDLPPETVPSA